MTAVLPLCWMLFWVALAVWAVVERGWFDAVLDSRAVTALDRWFGPAWQWIYRSSGTKALDRRLAMEIGPLSPGATTDLNASASICGNSAAMTGALLKAAFGGCAHPNALPVETCDGERVAVLCPDCDDQLPSEWKTATVVDEVDGSA